MHVSKSSPRRQSEEYTADVYAAEKRRGERYCKISRGSDVAR